MQVGQRAGGQQEGDRLSPAGRREPQGKKRIEPFSRGDCRSPACSQGEVRGM